jgi:predicted nuclease of predicted toxin-antitoxin system
MRFLVDECAGPAIARCLRDRGHDVVSIHETARGTDDRTILNWAHAERRILITSDKDFGEWIYRLGLPHCGVVLLRLASARRANRVAAIERLLASSADLLPDAFVVVTEKRVRFAKRT